VVHPWHITVKLALRNVLYSTIGKDAGSYNMNLEDMVLTYRTLAKRLQLECKLCMASDIPYSLYSNIVLCPFSKGKLL